jgi:hypothetical protein
LDQLLPLSPKKADAFIDFNEVIRTRDNLPLEERDRYNRQINDALKNLHKIGQSHAQVASLPLGQPDAVPKKTFKRKRQSESSRALTANEIGMKEQQQQDRQEQRQARDDAIDAARANGSPPSAQPRTDSPPPSTAPARMTRGGRVVKKTARKKEAQAGGLLPESQNAS